jgi:hypothetical protein
MPTPISDSAKKLDAAVDSAAGKVAAAAGLHDSRACACVRVVDVCLYACVCLEAHAELVHENHVVAMHAMRLPLHG